MVEIVYDEHLNYLPDLDEELGNNAEDTIDYPDEDCRDDYRTEKEQQADMGDYLKDRDYDLKMSEGSND